MRYKQNLIYVDQEGNIGPASLLRVINLDDYSKEAQAAFNKLQSGDKKGFERWSYTYGHRDKGLEHSKVYIPRGYSTLATAADKVDAENMIIKMKMAGYTIVEDNMPGLDSFEN